MKNSFFKTLILVLTVALILCLSASLIACGKVSNEQNSSSNPNSASESSSSLNEQSSSSPDEEQELNGLRFNSINIVNNCGYVVVSNATDRFSFVNEISVSGNSKFIVSLDEFGTQTSVTKVVPLSVGDNLIYIFEMVEDNIQNTYIITIRRRPIYVVAFNSNGGTSVKSQQVEEDSCASQPTENPTKNAYNFLGWDYDFSTPIIKNTTINANWSAVTYSLTYDLNGGALEQENPNEYTIESRFTLNAPARESYKFLGWYDGDKKITTLNGHYGNKHLTAKWEIIYNYSNGTITGLKSNYQNSTSLNIPSEINGVTITSIGYAAFSGCSSLTSIEIPNSVTSIGDLAFLRCSSLTSVVIGDSVTYIGYYAFWGCTSLTSIVIPDSVTSIGSDAFYNTEYYNNQDNWHDGVLYVGNHLIDAEKDISEIYKIKDSTLCIADSAFSGCSSLTSIVIPDSVISIGRSAFAYCSRLTSVVIPDSVTSIGNYAFDDCISLTSIYYKGTQSEWENISKGSYWDYDTGNYTITYNYVG